MASLTRREFFRGGFQTGRRVAAVATGNEQPKPVREPAGLGAIAGDFPPEMLALEAQRLGLDPDSTDRETLLAAVYAAMTGHGPGKAG